MLNRQRELTLPRLTAAPTATQLRVCLTLHFRWRQACTGKFHPIYQWFYLDCLECLPKSPPADAVAGSASRYAAQIAVFGEGFQKTLQAKNVFLVGAGALGCEFLKNFAMMGVVSISTRILG